MTGNATNCYRGCGGRSGRMKSKRKSSSVEILVVLMLSSQQLNLFANAAGDKSDFSETYFLNFILA